jgi:hypothetical protein
MKHFPRVINGVAVIAEVFRKELGIAENWMLPEWYGALVFARSRRQVTGQKTGARRSAHGPIGMSIREDYALLRQPLKVRRVGLGVTPKALGIVVEIVGDDKNDILVFGWDGWRCA